MEKILIDRINDTLALGRVSKKERVTHNLVQI